MAFVETYDYPTTRKRTSDNYVKFSPDYRLVLRILNSRAELKWQHWINEANEGRGMAAVCPNTATERECPIEKSLAGLAKDDPKVLERKAKKRYLVNVLDRTPYTVCPACNENTPKAKGCVNCGAALKNVDFAPLNKVKILEGGPQLFATSLGGIEKNVQEDYDDSDITSYDITFTTTGTGRDRKIAALPQVPPTPLPEDALIDAETGQEQKLWDLNILTEAATVEEIEAMLQGATVETLNKIRGIA